MSNSEKRRQQFEAGLDPLLVKEVAASTRLDGETCCEDDPPAWAMRITRAVLMANEQGKSLDEIDAIVARESPVAETVQYLQHLSPNSKETNIPETPKPPNIYETWLNCVLDRYSVLSTQHCNEARYAMNELAALREKAAKADVDEAVIRANERETILRAALDVRTRHAAANLMACNCADCRQAEAFTVRITSLYCRLSDFREHPEKSKGGDAR